MKYYLSSYKLGNEIEKLKELVSKTSGKFAYIPNARDFTTTDPQRKQFNIEEDMEQLKQVDVKIELLDLKDYFGKREELRQKLLSLGGLYVSGGNTFILRQAMKLSGFDELFLELSKRDDFVYAGYSAGVCVLCPTLKYYAITDNANDFPYPEISEQVWEGLRVLDFIFEPHYHSDHPESASTDKEIQVLIENKVLFKAYKDGEVLIVD